MSDVPVVGARAVFRRSDYHFPRTQSVSMKEAELERSPFVDTRPIARIPIVEWLIERVFP